MKCSLRVESRLIDARCRDARPPRSSSPREEKSSPARGVHFVIARAMGARRAADATFSRARARSWPPHHIYRNAAGGLAEQVGARRRAGIAKLGKMKRARASFRAKHFALPRERATRPEGKARAAHYDIPACHSLFRHFSLRIFATAMAIARRAYYRAHMVDSAPRAFCRRHARRHRRPPADLRCTARPARRHHGASHAVGNIDFFSPPLMPPISARSGHAEAAPSA